MDLRLTTSTPPKFAAPRPEDRPEDRLVAVVTEAGVRRGRKLAVVWHTARVVRTLGDAEGLVMFALRMELFGRNAWTLTVWRDAHAIAAFYGRPEHRRAVERSAFLLERFRTRRFAVTRAQLPIAWDQALGWTGEAARDLQRSKPAA